MNYAKPTLRPTDLHAARAACCGVGSCNPPSPNPEDFTCDRGVGAVIRFVTGAC